MIALLFLLLFVGVASAQPMPSGFVCIVNSDNSVTCRWDQMGAEYVYALRVDDPNNNSPDLLGGWYAPASNDMLLDGLSLPSYRIVSPVPDITYRAWVHTCTTPNNTSCGDAAFTNFRVALTPMPPPTPLVCVPNAVQTQNCTVNLACTPGVADATHDVATAFVFEQQTGGGPWIEITRVSTCSLSFTIPDEKGNIVYGWRSAGMNEGGQSAFADPIYGVSPVLKPPPVKAPNPPTGLKFSAISPTTIKMSWLDQSSDEGWFRAEMTGGGKTFAAKYPADTVSGSITGLNKNTKYSGYVYAGNDGGESKSNQATAKTPNK